MEGEGGEGGKRGGGKGKGERGSEKKGRGREREEERRRREGKRRARREGEEDMKASQNAIVVPMRGNQGCTHAWIGMVSVVGSHVSTSLCSRGRTIWSRMLSMTQEGRRGIQHSRRSITGLQIRGDHEEIVERNLGIQQSHTRRSYGSMLVVGRMEGREMREKRGKK